METGRFWLGPCQIDPRFNLIRRGDTEFSVNPLSMKVLVYLAEQPGDVVATYDLLTRVWPANSVSEGAVYKAISELREAFGDDAKRPRIIETLPRRGYRLLVRPSKEPADDSAPWWDLRSRVTRRASLAIALTLCLTAAITIVAVTSLSTVVVSFGGNTIGITVADTEDDVLELAAEGIAERLSVLRTPSAKRRASGLAPIVTDRMLHLERLGNAVIVTVTPGVTSAPHVDRYEMPPDGVGLFATVEVIVDTSVADLRVLTDAESLRRMQGWGTTHLHAWRLVDKANQWTLGVLTYEHTRQAADAYRQALEIDPMFSIAYVELGYLYRRLAEHRPLERDEYREKLLDLAARAELHGLREPAARLNLILAMMSSGDPTRMAEQVAARIMANPNDPEGLRDFERLLVGAGFIDEGQRYLERLDSIIDSSGIDADELTIAGARGDSERQIDLSKQVLERFPNELVTLLGVATKYALIGNARAADYYIARLEKLDDTGVWAVSARVRSAALLGELPRGSKELEAALSGPKVSNYTRGIVYFSVHDIENGVEAWRTMEPYMVPYLWQYLTNAESLYAPGVKDDPRYQELLNDIGAGSHWRTFLRQKVEELEPVTGIAATTNL